MDVLVDVVTGLLPTVGVTLLFGAAIWAIVRADASERTGRAQVEAEEDAADRAAVDEGRAGAVRDDSVDPDGTRALE